jgi:hypothetical protein
MIHAEAARDDHAPVRNHPARPHAPSSLMGTWAARAGKVRPVILLWALGVPLPILLIVFLVRGCSV